ncbi:MAG: hypothetical protein Q9166_006024 [cf. Caloplaca sp. 2 TL-2023]
MAVLGLTRPTLMLVSSPGISIYDHACAKLKKLFKATGSKFTDDAFVRELYHVEKVRQYKLYEDKEASTTMAQASARTLLGLPVVIHARAHWRECNDVSHLDS